jgi:hypothetical protein
LRQSKGIGTLTKEYQKFLEVVILEEKEIYLEA